MVERILFLMHERGISAYALTSEIGLNHNAITAWKKGKAKPSTDAIIKMAHYFGVTTDYLLVGSQQNSLLAPVGYTESKFIDRVFILMQERNINATALASAIGLNHGAISDWKKDKQNPGTEAVIKLSEYFGVTTDYLLLGKEQAEESQLQVITNPKEITNMNSNYRRFSSYPVPLKMKALRKEHGMSIEQLCISLNRLSNMVEIYDTTCEEMEGGYLFEDNSQDFINKAKAIFVEFYGISDLLIVNKSEYLEADEYPQTDLSLRIKMRMRKENLTPDELANELGVEVISVVSWISGERIPNQRCIQLLNGILTLGDDMMTKYENVKDVYSKANSKAV